MYDYDVIIIGAATSGSFLAKKLALLGRKVKVIEQCTQEKTGARYDIFHVAKREFARFNLPEVKEGDKEWAFEFEDTYTLSPYNNYPKYVKDRVVGMHMHDFIMLMNKEAIDSGAEIEYSACFNDFIYEKEKIAGVIYTNVNGESVSLKAKIVIDCSGSRASGRIKLKENSTVENFSLQDNDKFYVILRYVKFLDGKDYHNSSQGWPFYKTWIAPSQHLDGGIIGIGACNSYDYAEEIFEKFSKEINLPKHEVLYKEYGTTPYTRPPYSLVDDGFVAGGDSACLTKPNNGEGVTSSMVALEIIAEVVDEALTLGDYTKDTLWAINVRYNEVQGADFASTRAILTKAVQAKREEFEYFFKKDIIFSEKFLAGAAEGPDLKMSFKELLSIGLGIASGVLTGKISIPTLKLLLNGLGLMNKLKDHYKSFPLTPDGYNDWKKTADELWQKVGKMS